MGSASPPAGTAGGAGAAPAPATGAPEGPATRALPSVPNVQGSLSQDTKNMLVCYAPPQQFSATG